MENVLILEMREFPTKTGTGHELVTFSPGMKYPSLDRIRVAPQLVDKARPMVGKKMSFDVEMVRYQDGKTAFELV
jgi:hypothetical protein